ncbi:hypothetical protein [Scytonema millei]|uniref:Uncharacterized protein n=1 Tax=Scytonema millei VB511283 TaxID=1245923 RepID=A0A9X5E5X6_9CYAN|nr:hypothetical protein [Scytonema millei]NHC35905.1 hypothetical protein [Scytonema millei VB511283]
MPENQPSTTQSKQSQKLLHIKCSRFGIHNEEGAGSREQGAEGAEGAEGESRRKKLTISTPHTLHPTPYTRINKHHAPLITNDE